MARLLYGVMGDAWGHVTSSLAIASQLPHHEIVFVGGGRALELARYGYSVVPVPIIGTKLANQRVDTIATIKSGLATLRDRARVVARLKAVIREFDPDLILTDYEHFLPVAARQLGRACISADHNHIVTHCRYQPPHGHWLGRTLTNASMRTLYSAASHYLIYSFVPIKPIDPGSTEIFPTVVRHEVESAHPRDGEDVVVYVRGTSLAWLRQLLTGRRRRFLIYGYDIEKEEGNLSFRKYSVEGFVADLTSCSYVICNGGNTVISEALYCGKPLLCLPVDLFYEQILNADLVAAAGYGLYCNAGPGAAAMLSNFESGLPTFRRRIAEAVTSDRAAIISRLESLIATRGATGRTG